MVSCARQDNRPGQLLFLNENSCHCCDFAAAQCALSTVAIASMVSPGGCQSQSFFAFTANPFLRRFVLYEWMFYSA